MSVLFIGFNARAVNMLLLDKEDRMPVSGAAVFDAAGMLIAVSNANGVISLPDSICFPLNVSCMSYKSLSVPDFQDTLFLEPETILLQGVVVSADERPVVRLLCYIREFTSGAIDRDTVQFAGEYMTEYFIAEKKVKGFKTDDVTGTLLTGHSFARYIFRDGSDSIVPASDEEVFFSWKDMIGMDGRRLPLTEKLLNGSPVDSVMGKYGVKTLMRSSGDRLIVSTDLLADSKNHCFSPWIFKLLGMTIDCDEMIVTKLFNISDTDTYSAANMISMSASISMLAKGKILKRLMKSKTAVPLHSYVEIFPVEVEYLTPQEARELKATARQRGATMKLDSTSASPAAELLREVIDRGMKLDASSH